MENSKYINSKKRVQMAFNHQEPDRVPFCELAINHLVASKILNKDVYTGYGGYVRGKKHNEMLINGKSHEFYKRILDDTIELYKFIESDIFIFPPFTKNEIIPTEIQENIWLFEDKKKNFWETYKYLPDSDMYSEIDSNINKLGLDEFVRYVDILDNEDSGNEPDMDFASINYVRKATNNEMFILGSADISLPFTTSWFSVFLEAMVLKPEVVEKYLNIQTKKTIENINIQVELGVDGVWGGVDWAYKTGLIFSPKMWDYFIKPYLVEIVSFCHEKNILFIKHTDGNINEIITELILETHIDGLQAIEPTAGMDIYELKKKFGNVVTLWGNVDCSKTLVYGTKADIINETKEVIKKAAPGGGFILSSSNSIHNSIPSENFLLMREIGRQYGKYPINFE